MRSQSPIEAKTCPLEAKVPMGVGKGEFVLQRAKSQPPSCQLYALGLAAAAQGSKLINNLE